MPSDPIVSVVIPTFNERGSLVTLYPELCSALIAYPSELIIVDDGSPDGTAAYAETLAGPVTCVVRNRGRKLGLATAVQEGFALARGDVIVVMDADGSHPPSAIPKLVEGVTAGGAEFALGSRYIAGGSSPGLSRARRLLSRGATALARPLVPVADPMSGFFAFRREVLARSPLSPLGFKIGLEIMVRCHPAPIVEIPISFRPRTAGESKLGQGEIGRYLRHIGRLYGFRLVGSRRASSTR
ncbi:MAG: polyprenol monophosphomannose synthase [Thermoplasmata archaeon]|nr:polyprenol monophosphomannose synthase [Thermoplasmata archaeon]